MVEGVPMRVVVIGLGSMGRRRIRLLKTFSSVLEIKGIDLAESRRTQAEKECGIRTYPSLVKVLETTALDVAFVCTSPASHGSIVMECLEKGLNVFTEINLIGDWYDVAARLAKSKGLKLFISSTFLYRREIEYITNAVRGVKINYIYHSGQYLPDWHPWESYKDYFVSDKRTNACREILAFEFPWIIEAFGDVEGIYVMKGRNSSLDIDFADNYIISIRHKNGNKGVLCQDILSRKGLRRLEVFAETMHIFWEGTPSTLSVYDLDKKALEPITLYDHVEQREGYNANIIENAYREEIVDFFAWLDGKSTPKYSFAKDKKVLALIDRIEKSDQSNFHLNMGE